MTINLGCLQVINRFFNFKLINNNIRIENINIYNYN